MNQPTRTRPTAWAAVTYPDARQRDWARKYQGDPGPGTSTVVGRTSGKALPGDRT